MSETEYTSDKYPDQLYAHFAKGLADKDWFVFWGDVDEETCEMCGQFLLNALMKGKKHVTLFICSGGGSEDDSRALIGIMEICKQSDMIIRSYGAGCVASAAFDIFAACSPGYRFCFEVTMFMTHGSATQVEDEDMYKLQRRYDAWTLKTYTNIHASTRKRFLRTGSWWFDPATAVGYGVADAVVKAGHELPAGPIFPKRKSVEEQQQEAANGDDEDDE